MSGRVSACMIELCAYAHGSPRVCVFVNNMDKYQREKRVRKDCRKKEERKQETERRLCVLAFVK